MGLEYRIRFLASPADLDRDLRSLRFFSAFDPQYNFYNLRSDPMDVTGQPNAWVKIEPDGLYLCDSGGIATDRAAIFRSVVDLALKRSQKIQIEET